MPEKSQNKTNLQQCISIHITLPQIIPIQKNTQALKMMFPAAQNDKTKNARKQPKTKQYCSSTFYYIIPCHKLYLYKTTLKHEKFCSQLLKMTKLKMPESSQNNTNLQQCISLHITLPQIIPLQNDTQAIKIMFPAAVND